MYHRLVGASTDKRDERHHLIAMAKECPGCRTVDSVEYCGKCGYQFATNPKADIKPGPSRGAIAGFGCMGLLGLIAVIGFISSSGDQPNAASVNRSPRLFSRHLGAKWD